MSFSGTPLGQGRRLDHNTFLGKPPSSGAVPPSYAYGAPTLGSRSPPKPTSPSRDRGRHQDDENEENDPALIRFARLKQRESALDPAHRPGAPKVITSPPHPENWSVKDTSVNIATAFSQAASGDMSATYNHNSSWASTSRTNVVPRSTSVEYEASAPTTINRKLAPPPDKFNRNPNGVRKPLSKTASIRHVPDSEGEEDTVGVKGRGKSPFEQGVSFAKQALSAAAYYVRQRSHEPEETSVEQSSMNGINNGNDSSYDYAAEEKAFQAQKKTAAAHKRIRMSTDNKAYKPSLSSEDESEYSDDGKTKRRRRKIKKGPVGGPLTSLPMVGADKRRKRKGHGSKGNIGGPEEESESEEDNTQVESQSQTTQQRNSVLRTSNPPQSLVSISRLSQEPSRQHDPDGSLMSAEQGLHSIPEVEEELLPAEPVHTSSQQRRGRSRTPAPLAQPSATFSIGGLLGKIVHVVIKLFVWFFSGILSFLSMLTFLFGQVFGTTFDVILRRPAARARGAGPLLKYLVPGLVLAASWYALQSLPIGSYIPSLSFPSRSPTYHSPGVPPADIAALADRLLRIENAFIGLSADTERVKAKTDDGVKNFSDLLGRLGALEGRLVAETKKVWDTEARSRDVVTKSINGVKQEVEMLQSQLIAQQKQQQKVQRIPSDISDEEARAKLKALEERVGGVEGGVKEALELGKKAVSAVPPAAAAPVAPGAAWWNKLAAGAGSKTGLQIKSSDGQDVTALISHLVDNAVTKVGKDGVAKADYAMRSGGARVIPSLTSPTLEVKPDGVTAQIMGLLTGSGYAVGHMPVIALHPESHNGRCWPFAGTQGQLGVALAAPIFVDEVTIDHVAKEVAYDMRSAPREMEVWGMVEGKDNVERLNAWKAERAARKEAGEVDEYENIYPPTLPKHPEYVRLANFTYDIHASQNVQTFPVDQEVKALRIDFGIVALRVLNNWGRDDYTCLYRFRVHGQRTGEIPIPYSGHVADSAEPSP